MNSADKSEAEHRKALRFPQKTVSFLMLEKDKPHSLLVEIVLHFNTFFINGGAADPRTRSTMLAEKVFPCCDADVTG